MKRSQGWNTLQIRQRRDSNTGGSDLWSNTLPLDHGGALLTRWQQIQGTSLDYSLINWAAYIGWRHYRQSIINCHIFMLALCINPGFKWGNERLTDWVSESVGQSVLASGHINKDQSPSSTEIIGRNIPLTEIVLMFEPRPVGVHSAVHGYCDNGQCLDVPWIAVGKLHPRAIAYTAAKK